MLGRVEGREGGEVSQQAQGGSRSVKDGREEGGCFIGSVKRREN